MSWEHFESLRCPNYRALVLWSYSSNHFTVDTAFLTFLYQWGFTNAQREVLSIFIFTETLDLISEEEISNFGWLVIELMNEPVLGCVISEVKRSKVDLFLASNHALHIFFITFKSFIWKVAIRYYKVSSWLIISNRVIFIIFFIVILDILRIQLLQFILSV